MILPDAPASAADDTEVVPPKNEKQLDRLQHASMPYPLVEGESSFNPDYA
jgi:hypothetical protein